LSSAAILAIYTAGYERTAPAAVRFAAQLAQRRLPTPLEEKIVGLPILPERLEAPQNDAPEPKKAAAFRNNAAPAESVTRTPAEPAAVTGSSRTVPAALTLSDVVTTASTESTSEPDVARAVPSTPYRDGVYLGWGYSRHGNIQAFVRIEGGRIIRAGIERCETRWSCDFVAHLPGQVVQRQSAEVDYVTGATQSGDAFYGGIVAALSQAK
jgi:uncharacterized protein with FMN-binding domain